ncbi:hypothetical protein [Actinomadura sp. B10D3]|uniref:hypothetical protein n=1 Tax=Actinomadura sp. B10D3 TaxID=3153557 RepID=UPI00325E0ED6
MGVYTTTPILHVNTRPQWGFVPADVLARHLRRGERQIKLSKRLPGKRMPGQIEESQVRIPQRWVKNSVRKFSKAAVLALTSAAIVAGSIAAPTAASAASTPTAACGNGFRVIDRHTLGGAVIYLMYDGKVNCVVTWKTDFVGTKTDTEAYLFDGVWPAIDSGDYKYYAGPVYGGGPGRCVAWGGYARDKAKGKQTWYSEREHCG